MKGILTLLLALIGSLISANPTKLNRRMSINRPRISSESSVVSTPIKMLPATTVSDKLIFSPPATYNDPQVLYARTVELENGDILATWENYSPEPPLVYAPIYRSQDGGVTWSHFSNITDQVNGWGLRYQPFLYRTPVAIGGYAKNTIFYAGNSIPANLSATQIDLYASTDHGHTWHFVSRVASGGAAIPDDGVPAIWEPFLLVWNNMLVCYYSDQRDLLYGQKLVYQTTTNLRDWNPVVNTVNYTDYYARPGMFTTAQLANGSWIATYEFGGAPGYNGLNGTNYDFPAYYKIANDPVSWDLSIGYPIVATDGSQMFSSPYIVTSSYGGKNGTIIMNSESNSQVFVNTKMGAFGSHWVSYATPQPSAYTRNLRILQKNPRYLMITGAGYLPPASDNQVTTSVVDLAVIEY